MKSKIILLFQFLSITLFVEASNQRLSQRQTQYLEQLIKKSNYTHALTVIDSLAPEKSSDFRLWLFQARCYTHLSIYITEAPKAFSRAASLTRRINELREVEFHRTVYFLACDDYNICDSLCTFQLRTLPPNECELLARYRQLKADAINRRQQHYTYAWIQNKVDYKNQIRQEAEAQRQAERQLAETERISREQLQIRQAANPEYVYTSQMSVTNLRRVLQEKWKLVSYAFNFNYIHPNASGQEFISKIIALMKEDTTLRLTIAIYCDGKGNKNANKFMAETRANKLYKIFNQAGISQSHIIIKAEGTSRYHQVTETDITILPMLKTGTVLTPQCIASLPPNIQKNAHAMNRRIEINLN